MFIQSDQEQIYTSIYKFIVPNCIKGPNEPKITNIEIQFARLPNVASKQSGSDI